jgi:hypothetical protein
VTKRQVATIGGIVGLTVSSLVLVLLWVGVLGALRLRGVDWVRVLWPSSVMLTLGWCCTLPGILITISSIAINCLLYVVIALLLRAGVRLIVKLSRD